MHAIYHWDIFVVLSQIEHLLNRGTGNEYRKQRTRKQYFTVYRTILSIFVIIHSPFLMDFPGSRGAFVHI